MGWTAYFDCFAGASGDMLLGSLLDAGLDEGAWRAELQKLPLTVESLEVVVERVRRQGLAATKLTVRIAGVEADTVPQEAAAADEGGTEATEHKAESRPTHHGAHSHSRAAHHAHHGAGHHHSAPPHAAPPRPAAEAHGHSHAHEQARGVRQIHALLDAAPISSAARRLAREIFWNLAVAEGRVHGIAPEEVHFHEVGAVDAIIDITGFAIGYELLGIERAIVSPLTVGSGMVRCAHGLMPVPVPAVVELLRMGGAPLGSHTLEGECLTPTGAAILITIAAGYAATPPFRRIDRVGYGAGRRDVPTLPNVVRLLLGAA
ncbi:MAG: LarC family nickel insertion protein [Candidatus Tectomicrobia bacterium]|nr:LarC family nickel insertion protein [Candidatus Tectomicrobia bacterium]